jgi:very-short-patch-repair endonuclease
MDGGRLGMWARRCPQSLQGRWALAHAFDDGRGSDSDVPATHVTVAGEGRSRPGIRVHRSPTLSPADLTLRGAIPVTKPARTLRDLRRTVPGPVFVRALRQAEFLRLPLDGVDTDHTRSGLEARFLALLRRHRLPRPEVNVRVEGFVVDFLWRVERLIAELDGWETHRTRSAFEQDRARDNQLRRGGFEVVRFTWRQVTDDPSGVAATVRSLPSGEFLRDIRKNSPFLAKEADSVGGRT